MITLDIMYIRHINIRNSLYTSCSNFLSKVSTLPWPLAPSSRVGWASLVVRLMGYTRGNQSSVPAYNKTGSSSLDTDIHVPDDLVVYVLQPYPRPGSHSHNIGEEFKPYVSQCM